MSVTNTAHSVVEKTKSSTETIRLNGLINDEEKNINAAYLNMGRKYAELHTADAEPEFQEFLSAIAASQEKIAEYREQIRKTKHLLICQVRGRKSGGQTACRRTCRKRSRRKSTAGSGSCCPSGGCSGTTGSGWCRVLSELRQTPHGWCDVLYLLRKSLCGCGTYACTGSGSRSGRTADSPAGSD